MGRSVVGLLTAGMGFFTDAYDLFIISAALGVAGTLRITFLFAMVGVLLTMLLPDHAARTLRWCRTRSRSWLRRPERPHRR